MGALAHKHDWAAVPGGYRCQNCSASLSDAVIGANAPSSGAQANKNFDWTTHFSQVYRNKQGEN